MKSPDNESADFSAMGIDYMMRFEAMQAELAALQCERDRLAAALKVLKAFHESAIQLQRIEPDLYKRYMEAGEDEDATGVIVEYITAALSGSSAALDKMVADAKREALEEAERLARTHMEHGEFTHGGRDDCAEAIADELAALRSSTGSGEAQEGAGDV